jgi:ketosteroid isomerase-like protein
MKRICIAILILLIPISLSLAQTNGNSAGVRNSSEQEVIIALEREWDEALVAEDVNALNRILANDFVISGTDFTKEAYLEMIKKPEFRYTSASKENIKVKVYGNTAVVIARHSISSEYGKNYARGSTYSMMNVWVIEGSQWRVVATSADSINIERNKAK